MLILYQHNSEEEQNLYLSSMGHDSEEEQSLYLSSMDTTA